MSTTNFLAQMQAYYGEVYTSHESITEMRPYDYICYLQKQFNHVENSVNFNDKTSAQKAFDLLESEHKETLDAIAEKDIVLLRDGIADQLTISHFLAFVIDGMFDLSSDLLVKPTKTISEYRQQLEEAFKIFKQSFMGDDVETANAELANFITAVLSFPLETNINSEDDLLSVTFSSLSKVCPNQDVAEKTLKFYQDNKYDVHIAPVPNGLAIFVSNDCEIEVKSKSSVRTEIVPKGKFLKSIYKLEPYFSEIEFKAQW